MAFTGRATYDDFAVEHVRDLSEQVELVGLDEVPFLNYLGDANTSVNGTKHEWHTHTTWYASDTINESGTFSAGDTTLTVSHGSYFKVAMIILIDDELLYISAISTNDLTVVRGYGGTTDADHADGTTIYIQSQPRLEGRELGTPYYRTASQVYNYTQIFSHDVKLSATEWTQAHVGLPNGMSRFDLDLESGVRFLLRQLERMAINGYYYAGTPQGSSTIPRTMGGLRQYCTGTVDASSVALSESTHISPALLAQFEGGSNPDTILTSGKQMQVIASWLTPHRRYGSGADTLERKVLTYDSTLGIPITVIASPHVSPDELFILDSSKISVMPLAGRSFQYKELSTPEKPLGDWYGGMVVGEYTMEVLNGATHHRRIYDLG